MRQRECCLSTAILIAFIISIFWYTRATTLSVTGYWATLNGNTYEITESPTGGLKFTGIHGVLEGGISPFRTLWMGKMSGYLMPDGRTISWYGGDDWFRQGV
jgi:hypothetical protein